MGSRGPIPDLDVERARRRGTDPAAATVKMAPAAPDPPTWLDREAKAEWKRVVPVLNAQGLLSKVDRGILATYCSTWSTFVRAEREIGGALLVEGYRGGMVKNPLLQIRRDTAALCLQLSKELLITPVTRLRTAAATPDDGGDSDGILD